MFPQTLSFCNISIHHRALSKVNISWLVKVSPVGLQLPGKPPAPLAEVSQGGGGGRVPINSRRERGARVTKQEQCGPVPEHSLSLTTVTTEKSKRAGYQTLLALIHFSFNSDGLVPQRITFSARQAILNLCKLVLSVAKGTKIC